MTARLRILILPGALLGRRTLHQGEAAPGGTIAPSIHEIVPGLELNPRDAQILVTLAGYYVVIDENEKAWSLTEQALTMAPNKLFMVYFTGCVYEQLGDKQRNSP